MKSSIVRSAAFVSMFAMPLLLGGCVSLGVKPWERDLLARQSMQLNTHPHLMAADEHTYFSKEGSSGGRSFDGGGCGCN